MACNDKGKGLNRIGQAIIGPSWHFIISVFQFISRPRTWMDLLLIYFKFRIIRLLDVLSKFPDFLTKHDAGLFVIIQCGKEMKIEHTGTRANNFFFISFKLTNNDVHAIIRLWKFVPFNCTWFCSNILSTIDFPRIKNADFSILIFILERKRNIHPRAAKPKE